MNSDVLKSRFNLKRKFAVILARPEKAANIGGVARVMKNTGFAQLRVVGLKSIPPAAYQTAVHAGQVLSKARLFSDLSQATADCQLIFAATSKKRKNFSLISLEEAVSEMLNFPALTRIGLLFGCERTGLTGQELRNANFIFRIPQACLQPSYNLVTAVAITLFQIFNRSFQLKTPLFNQEPLPRSEQELCIRLILAKLEEKRFLHKTNRKHVADMLYDLLGRLTMTAQDKKLLLALFSKGVNGKE
ncbi:MAG: RNA methyltransferase [Candidatus Aminicenantales bacterium]